MADQALATVGHWLSWLLVFALALFGAIEDAMRGLMDRLGIAAGLQTIIIVLLAVALLIAAIRLFGGVLRLLLTVFLVLLVVHVVTHYARL